MNSYSTFTLYYQPKINIKTKKIHSCEALIRLIKNSKVIYPNDFIPQAEKDGSIIEIDKWVLKRISEDAREIFTKTFGEKITISFNISAIHFNNKDIFYKTIINLLKNTKDFNSSFEIEITESALIKDKKKSINTILRLKEKGLTFALDDFGTGYASLKLFKLLPIDTLKIDKLFVNDMINNKKAFAIVDAILYLAKKLKITTVAEGVEEIEQVNKLAAVHCDELQGYFYSKPLPLKKFILYLTSINKPQKENQFIQWSTKYATNFMAFDSQHMIIINLLNSIYEVLRDKTSRKEAELKDYTDIVDNFISIHFDLEEKYMIKHNYPKTKEHILEHRRFAEKFQAFQNKVTATTERNIFNLFNLLKEWFIHHELKQDKQLVVFIKKQLTPS